MTTYRYLGRAYRQALDENAPWLLSFVANADELTQWAGVPRRSEQNRTGFQRLEDPTRVDEAKKYFQQPQNQSPTSLILGLHGEMSSDIGVELRFLDENDLLEADSDTGGSRPCELIVNYDEPTIQAACDIVRKQLKSRIQVTNDVEGEGNSAQAESSSESDGAESLGSDLGNDSLDEGFDEEGISETDGNGESGEDEDDVDEDDELELGQSVVEQLITLLDDEEWISKDDNAAAILDLAKPATIIDGQHRLAGADATERSIPFSVVALADCPWPEQVFQFTVVNYTAKGIPDQFITANAALSLTKTELDSLKTRLIQANVKIKEYDLMRVVNFDPRSPFSNLINLTEKSNSNLIGYKTMVRIARQWFDASHQFFNTLLPRLYPDISGKGSKTKRKEKWREADWGEFFLAFWQEVYKKFRNDASHEKGHTLWQVGHSQLTVAVVLLELQTAFLDNLNAQDEELVFGKAPEGEDEKNSESEDELDFLLARVGDRAKKFVTFFPPAFFSTKWAITSLNTGAGRKDLHTCIKAMVEAKGKYQYASDRLITGG